MPTVNRNITVTVAIICLFMASVVGLFVYKMTQPRIMTVKELVANGAVTFETPKPIEPFQVLAHNGQAFSEADLKGKWTLLFFGFSHCDGFCPATLALLNSMMPQLEADIRAQTQVVMVSVDPARDTVPVLADYMGRFNEDFIGLTGEFLPLRLLADQFHIGFRKVPVPAAAHGEGHEHHADNEADYEVQHGEQIALINPAGQYHGFFNPPFTLARLKATYQSIVISNQ